MIGNQLNNHLNKLLMENNQFKVKKKIPYQKQENQLKKKNDYN